MPNTTAIANNITEGTGILARLPGICIAGAVFSSAELVADTATFAVGNKGAVSRTGVRGISRADSSDGFTTGTGMGAKNSGGGSVSGGIEGSGLPFDVLSIGLGGLGEGGASGRRRRSDLNGSGTDDGIGVVVPFSGGADRGDGAGEGGEVSRVSSRFKGRVAGGCGTAEGRLTGGAIGGGAAVGIVSAA